MNNKVSVIIPFYNNPDELVVAITSVINQTYKNIEIIIVDDGSEVDYSYLIDDFRKKTYLEIKYIKQENTGPGLARQNGLNRASGRFIQYLDSDDEILPEKIQLQVGILNNNPTAIMVYGLSQLNGNPTKIRRSKDHKCNEENVLVVALQKRKWGTCSCLWNYDTSLVYWEDLTNGEDVLHDVNAGLLNTNKSVIFHAEIVANITTGNSLDHLSNAGYYSKKHKKLVRDASELNARILKKIVDYGLLNESLIRESLVERCFYEGLKFYKINFKKDGEEMLKLGLEINKNTFKFLEFKISLFIAKFNKLTPKIVSFIFKAHRVLVSERIHQRRRL